MRFVRVGQERVSVGMRQDAADELAAHLLAAAATLATKGLRPKRVGFGPSRAGVLFKRRSPRGFVVDKAGQRVRILLPDGRLWQYHERRDPEGTYYDARTDHARAMHGSIPWGGGRFSFLGAVVGKYHFGYLENPALAETPKGFEVGAIFGQDGTAASYLEAEEAFAAIIDAL